MTDPGRLDIEFDSGGVTCRAWLYLPAGDRPHPVIVMGHGLGAVREMGLAAYAERFRDAGYACVVFDYRHFGESDGQPRQLLDIARQRQDWAAALTFVRGRAELDPERTVAWGSSFGGGHVIATAAHDHRLAAAIAQCPFTDGIASSIAVNPVTSLRVTARAVRDLVAARLGRQPVMVATAGGPRAAALMSAPDVVPGYLRLVPDGVQFRNEVAARVALAILAYRPGRSASQVDCPILFCVCDNDSVAPAKATLRYAKEAPRGEIVRYPVGHFDIYTGEFFERAVADQLAFLSRHV